MENKYTVMINRNSNTSWDYKNPRDSVEQYPNLTKELLYILYSKESLYDRLNDFIILSNDTPLSNNELFELGLIDRDNNYLKYPNGKSDLLNGVMEYIASKQGIYLYGDFRATTDFLVNLIANYNGNETLCLFSRFYLKYHSIKLNGDIFSHNIFNRLISRYGQDHSELREQINNVSKDSFVIIDGLGDHNVMIELAHILKEKGCRYIITERTIHKPFYYYEIEEFMDSSMKCKDSFTEEDYRVMDLYIEDEYYNSYKYDESSKRIFEIEYSKKSGISFSDVAGFNELKSELIKISGWWKDYKRFDAKGISLPRGILFYGGSGNGKSLMARAFINEISDVKVLSIDNEDEILTKFELAKEHPGLVIIFMDELEYLYHENQRDLLNVFDSLNSSSNVFLIATTNNLDRVEGPLIRRGRLDYLIEIGRPKEKERIEILKYYFAKCKVEVDLDYNYLAYITTYLTSAELKALVNDSILRYGNKLTISNLETEIDRIRNRCSVYYGDYDDNSDYMTAVHEIGHTIAVLENQDYFTFYKTTLESNSRAQGLCRYIAKKDNLDDSKRMIADIDISLAGYLACKVLYNYDSTGCVCDLESARNKSAALINSYGYGGFDRLLNHSRNCFMPSNQKMHHNELASKKILKESEKRVRKLIKKNKKLIITLSNLLYEKKVITLEDIKAYM